MRQAIGIDIGGTKIRSAVVSDEGTLLRAHDIPTPRSATEVVQALKGEIERLKDEATTGIGIGVPGRVDAAAGRVFSGGFVDLSGRSLRDEVAAQAGLPVHLANDASLALLAEARVGAAQGWRNVAMFTIGTGIGGAIMCHGELLAGRATAGQLGHIGVDQDGAPCLCGRRGCVETTSSGTALGRLLAAAGLASLSVEDLLERRDAESAAVLLAWIRPLRSAIDSVVATLDPERVVLGGGLGHAAVRALAHCPPASPWFQYEVVPARLGNDAGVIGAALLSLEAAS